MRVVGTFPANSHPAITYPIAVLRASTNPDADGFRRFLISREGKAIFARLVETADAVIENFRPDVKDRLGTNATGLELEEQQKLCHLVTPVENTSAFFHGSKNRGPS